MTWNFAHDVCQSTGGAGGPVASGLSGARIGSGGAGRRQGLPIICVGTNNSFKIADLLCLELRGVGPICVRHGFRLTRRKSGVTATPLNEFNSSSLLLAQCIFFMSSLASLPRG